MLEVAMEEGCISRLGFHIDQLVALFNLGDAFQVGTHVPSD
jgi:hypothetical protein